MTNNNANKGKRAEKRAEEKLRAKRDAGPNSPDLRRGKDRVEVKNYKNPLNKTQLQNARQQNNANVIVSESGYTKEAIEYAEKNMPRIQLRAGKGGGRLVKRRKAT